MTYWTIKDVINFTRLSESSVRRMTAAGTFPVSHKLIGRRRVWNPADVRAWADAILETAPPSEPSKPSGFLSKFR